MKLKNTLVLVSATLCAATLLGYSAWQTGPFLRLMQSGRYAAHGWNPDGTILEQQYLDGQPIDALPTIHPGPIDIADALATFSSVSLLLLPAALILGLHMDQHLTKKRFLLAAGIYTIAVVVVDPMGLVLLVLWLMAAFGLMLVKFVKRRPQSQAIAAHSDRRWPKAFAILATLGLALVLAATLYVTRDLRVHSDLGAASASATLPRSPEALGARPQYHATMTAHAMTAIPPEE